MDQIKRTPATPLRTGADVQAHPMDALTEIARLRAVNEKLVEALRGLQRAAYLYQNGTARNILDMPKFKESEALLREIGEDA